MVINPVMNRFDTGDKSTPKSSATPRMGIVQPAKTILNASLKPISRCSSTTLSISVQISFCSSINLYAFLTIYASARAGWRSTGTKTFFSRCEEVPDCTTNSLKVGGKYSRSRISTSIAEPSSLTGLWTRTTFLEGEVGIDGRRTACGVFWTHESGDVSPFSDKRRCGGGDWSVELDVERRIG